MSTKHTPEPWALEGWLVVEDHGIRFAVADIMTSAQFSTDVEVSTAVKEANGRRIVACVNACQGIETECLEHTHGLNELYDELIRQRDALLSALQRLVTATSAGFEERDEAEEGAAWEHAQFVMAKVKGGA